MADSDRSKDGRYAPHRQCLKKNEVFYKIDPTLAVPAASIFKRFRLRNDAA